MLQKRCIRYWYLLLIFLVLPLTFSYGIFAAPTQSTPILNASSSNNLTLDNLIALNVSTSDIDGNDVFNVYNWYLGDRSLTVLAMSFDHNDSSVISNIVKDYSGFGNNGSLGSGNITRAPRWTPNGISGGAYAFDGVDDRFVVSDTSSLDLNNSLTLEAWVYMNTTSGDSWNTFIAKYDSTPNQRSFILGTNKSGSPRMALCLGILDSCEYVQARLDLTLNSWQYVVGTYDGEVMKLYINGSLVRSIVYTNGTFNGTADVSLGGSPYGGLNLNGSLDEVRIYNYTLTAGQIQTNYNHGFPKFNLINYSMTSANQVWSVNVTPVDLNDDGQTLPSNFLTILNTAPSSMPGLYPSSININKNVIGYSNFTDNEDTDCGGIYNWYINESIIETGNLSMLFLLDFDQPNGSGDVNTSDNELPLRHFNYSHFNGKFGKDIYISTDDILEYSSINNIKRDAGTILFWLQPDWNASIETKERPFFQDENQQFYLHFNPIDNSIILNITINNTYTLNLSTGDLSNDLIDNQWTHIAVTWNKTLDKIEIYVNGTLAANNTLDLEWFDNYPLISDLYIGSTSTISRSATSHFDEFAIFGNDLPFSHITDIINRDVPIFHNEVFLDSSNLNSYAGTDIKLKIIPYDCVEYGSPINSSPLTIPVANLYYTDATINKTVIGSQGSVQILAHWYSTAGLTEAWLEINDSGYLYNTSVREVGYLIDDMVMVDWSHDYRSRKYDDLTITQSVEGYIGSALNLTYQYSGSNISDYVYARKTIKPGLDLTAYDYLNYYMKADAADVHQTRVLLYNVTNSGNFSFCNYTAYPDLTANSWQRVQLNMSIFQEGDCDLTNISAIKVTINDVTNAEPVRNGSVLFDEMYLTTETKPTDIAMIFNYRPNTTLPSGRNITLRMFMKDEAGYINSTSLFNLHIDTDVPQLFNVNFTNNYSRKESEMKFRGLFNDSTQLSSFWFEIENDSTRYNTSARPVGYYIDTFDDSNWVYASGIVKGPNVTIHQENNGYIGRALAIDYNYSNASGTDYFFLEVGIDPIVNISLYDALVLQVKSDKAKLHQLRLDLWCDADRPPESYSMEPYQHMVHTEKWEQIEFLTKEYYTDNPNCSLTRDNITRLKLEFGDFNDSSLFNGTILIDELRLIKKDNSLINNPEVPLWINWINFDEQSLNYSLRIYFNDTTGNENYTRWFNITQQDFDVGSSVLVQDNGSLLDEVRLWRNNMIQGNWTSPSNLEKRLMKNYTLKILEGINTNNLTLLQNIASNLTGLGLELVNYSDNVSNYNFYLIREINDSIVRGWGVFLFNPNSPANLILEAPHPQWDTNSSILAMNYFLEIFPKALIINSVYRYANHKHDTDAGHSIDILYHPVHEALVENTSEPIILQIHGYASSGLSDSSLDIVISDAVGINKSQIILDIEHAFLNQSYNTCVWPYNCSDFSATNEASAHDSVKKDGEFVHIEFDTPYRINDALLPNVLRGLTNVFDWRPPEVTLLSPTDGQALLNGSINFTCYVGDINNVTNVSLFINSTGAWHLNQTKNVNNNYTNITFNLNLSDGNYVWNCKATDLFNNTRSGITNFSINVSSGVDLVQPLVSLISPVNDSTSSVASNMFTYEVTDENGLDNCSLILNGNVSLTSISVINGSSNTFTKDLTDGTYNWTIRCFDTSQNSATPTVRWLTLLIASSSSSSTSTSGRSSSGGSTQGLEISLDSIDEIILRNKLFTSSFTIKNTKSTALSVVIDLEGLEEILFLDETSFVLDPQQTRQINLNFLASNTSADFYSGSLKINNEEISVTIQIKEPVNDFNITTTRNDEVIIEEDNLFYEFLILILILLVSLSVLYLLKKHK